MRSTIDNRAHSAMQSSQGNGSRQTASQSIAYQLYQATERVIGQEKARRQLAVLLSRQVEVAQGKWPKAECAVIGGFTGVGKTYMARMMCEYTGLPFADVNSTQYTETGYAGDDLSQMFLPLIES